MHLMDIFRYKQAELDYLRKKDKKLAAAIDRIGIIERGVDKDLFSALIGSIVSQQISNKAAEFGAMTDAEIIGRLSALPGIGVWTAEMLLIFSLERKDVLSYGDLAIRRGICNLYGHKTISKEQFERYRRRYSPYCSIASLYLWELSKEEKAV